MHGWGLSSTCAGDVLEQRGLGRALPATDFYALELNYGLRMDEQLKLEYSSTSLACVLQLSFFRGKRMMKV